MNPFPRSWILPSASVAYVAFASFSVSSGWARWFSLIGLPVFVGALWRRFQNLRDTGLLRTAVGATQAAAWGLGMFLAARTAPAGRAAFDAAANLGTGLCSVAALFALARLAPPSGLLQGHPAARSKDAAVFASVLWGIAVGAPAAHALLPGAGVDPLTIDYATTAASIGSLFVLLASTGRMIALRGLELGVGDRARAALVLAITGSLVAVLAAVFSVASPDRLSSSIVTLVAIAVTWTAATTNPATVTIALRGFLGVVLLALPIALATTWLAQRLPEHLGAVVLIGALGCVVAGLAARTVARPLGPQGSRWIAASHRAMERALLPEPEGAIRAALGELGQAQPSNTAQAELWRRDPPAILRVDVAGYLHETAADFPELLAELAAKEPERTLRAATVRSLEVRRPELRVVSAWFESHGAFCATSLHDDDGLVGLLVMPRGARRAALTLEEARALRLLADRMSGLLSISSAMARSRERELGARTERDTVVAERDRLESVLADEACRRVAEAESFAEPLRASAHGPSATFALEELRRLATITERLVFFTPPGVDPRGWAAAFHLESKRRWGPFVRVDGASRAARDLETWTHERTSPLARSAGGTLLIEDPLALPNTVFAWVSQEILKVTDTGVVLSISRSEAFSPPEAAKIGTKTTGGELPPLLRNLPTVRLPTLEERGEDLRSLVLAELASAGLRLRGEPLGVEPAALRDVSEHAWPGNDLELRALLRRAASLAQGPLVTAENLRAAGLPAAPEHGLTPRPVVDDEAPLDESDGKVAREPRRRARRAPRSRMR